VSLIVDSTGMQFGRASEWHEQKYGRKAAHTPWRKVNLSNDPDMNVHAVSVTETTVSDTVAMDAVLAVDCPVDRVIADGGRTTVLCRFEWNLTAGAIAFNPLITRGGGTQRVLRQMF